MELRRRRPFKLHAYQTWDERRWRLHRYAYARLTEAVDSEIGIVLQALRRSGREADTIVVHTSDHGDHDGSHKLEHKTALYREACRVPFTVSAPGGRRRAVDTEHLVSTGIDLLPTLCDLAGVQPPDRSPGLSVRPAVDGHGSMPDRPYVRIECSIGGAVVSDRFMYVLYDSAASREQLYDLVQDPGQTRNFAHDAGHAEVLREMRMVMQSSGA